MSKTTVTKLFLGGIIAVVAGIVLAALAVFGAIASGVFQMDGPDVVGINATPFAWTMVIIAIGGVMAIIGGGIAGLVSWIGALLNTVELEDKSWFILLLVLGIFNFGLIAMIAYVVAGPDGTSARRAMMHSGA